jgi:hypothetical protein
MPSCWFLLSRHYLRVDGSLTRCRETRMFHRFSVGSGEGGGGAVVEMEVCWRELRAAVDGPGALASVTKPAQTGAPGSKGMESTVFKMAQSQIGVACTRPQGTQGTAPGGMEQMGQRAKDHLLRSDQGKTQSQLLPLVNDAAGVHQFHALVWKEERCILPYVPLPCLLPCYN